MTTDHNFSQNKVREICKKLVYNYPPNACCVTSLPCKILITILVVFHWKHVIVLFWQYLCQFSFIFRKFWKSHIWWLFRFSFCLMSGTILKLDLVLWCEMTHQCDSVPAHCGACKMTAVLALKISELIGPDLCPHNRTTFQTFAVTLLLLFHLHEADLKLRFYTYCHEHDQSCDQNFTR